MKKAILAISILLTAFSCASVSVDCDYSVTTWQILRLRGETEPLSGTRVYAFRADTAEWGVISYSDAIEGRITSRNSGAKRGYDFFAVPDADGQVHSLTFTEKGIMILVVAEEQPMYAYGNSGITDNLSNINAKIVFHPYLSDTVVSSTSSNWKIIYEDTFVPVNCEYTIQPVQTREENGAASPLTSVRAHVFYGADTTRWAVKSYADAVAGILTPLQDGGGISPERENIEIRYGGGSSFNEISMTLTDYSAMLVLYDESQPMFGYANADFTDNPLTRIEQVSFLPYRADTTYMIRSRWFMQNENTEIFSMLTVTPKIIGASGNESLLSAVKMYAFYVDDTSSWAVGSYEDAMAGRLVSTDGNGDAKTFDLENSPDDNASMYSLRLTQRPVVIVVCHTGLPLYAAGRTNLGGWPENIRETVTFRERTNGENYDYGMWKFNEDFVFSE